jgi:hypothetical protein
MPTEFELAARVRLFMVNSSTKDEDGDQDEQRKRAPGGE